MTATALTTTDRTPTTTGLTARVESLPAGGRLPVPTVKKSGLMGCPEMVFICTACQFPSDLSHQLIARQPKFYYDCTAFSTANRASGLAYTV
jgi:hypothetical protein